MLARSAGRGYVGDRQRNRDGEVPVSELQEARDAIIAAIKQNADKAGGSVNLSPEGYRLHAEASRHLAEALERLGGLKG